MLAASAEENFEMAAAYRDAIRTVEDVAERQVVQSLKGESVDVFGFFESGRRRGGLRSRRARRGAPGPAGVLLREVRGGRARRLPGSVPPAVLRRQPVSPRRRSTCPSRSRDRELLEEFLLSRRGREGRRARAQRGAAARARGAGADTNAQQRHRVRFRRAGGEEPLAVERLARVLGPARAAAADRGLRHLAPAGHRQHRVARRLRGRQAEEVRLPALRHRLAEPARAGRLPEHGRSGRAPLPAAPRRGRGDARPRRSSTEAAASSRPRSPRSTGWVSSCRSSASPSGRRRSGCRTAPSRSASPARTRPCS